MKKNRLFRNILSLLVIAVMLASFTAISAFAAPESGDGDYSAAEPAEDPAGEPAEQVPDTPASDEPADTPQDDGGADTPAAEEVPDDSAQQPEDSGTADDGMYDYITGYVDDAESNYQAPENLGDLPEAAPTEVIFATTMVLPDVAVSDASLTSGIIMWMCVAVGIAVVVGVMVSKRTRRRAS